MNAAEEAWEDGYHEDAWHLATFGQYLPTDMVMTVYQDDPALTAAFVAGSAAHTADVQNRRTKTTNPYRKTS